MPEHGFSRTLTALAVAAMVAACGPASNAHLSPPPASVHDESSLRDTAASSVEADARATSTPDPTASPEPEPLVLGGTWLSPKAGSKLRSYGVTFSARPTAIGTGVTTFSEVVFWASWHDAAKRVMCRATKPGSNGAWSCKANLLAQGVPPGALTLTFDVHGVGVKTARSPAGSRKVTYAVAPPKPTAVSWENVAVDPRTGMPTYRVRWSAPAGYADQFLVYETFECPLPATSRNNGNPCFGPGTKVDTSQLQLLATAAGTARWVKVRPQAECWPSSVLIRARNAYGKSSFTIVDSAPVIWLDPHSNDVIC